MFELTAGIVCEGPTDFPILQAILTAIVPEIGRVLPIQPPLDELGKPKGATGWSSVEKWCTKNAGNLESFLSDTVGDPIDILVIAIDLDIAVRARIVNPPRNLTAYATKRLCDRIKSWLGAPRRRLPSAVVLAVPAMATETWVIAAKYPRHDRPESNQAPATFLASKGQLRTGEDGRPLKDLARYQHFAMRIEGRLDRVRRACPEADRLCGKLETRRTALLQRL